jgi:hypothetical protein
MHRCNIHRLASVKFALICVCALLLLPSAALADLNPGDTQYNPQVNPPFNPSFTVGPVPAAYNIPVASMSFPYAFNGTSSGAYNGSVLSSVFKNSSGQLAFSYVFDNLLPPAGGVRTDISHATVNDPSNPWTGVTIFGTGADGSGLSTAVPGAFGSWTNGNPFDITRDAGNSGVGVFFNAFSSGTELVNTTNDRSASIWFTTDATTFHISNVGLIDTGTTGTGNAYAPGVPEPSSLVLLALGALGAAFIGRQLRSN